MLFKRLSQAALSFTVLYGTVYITGASQDAYGSNQSVLERAKYDPASMDDLQYYIGRDGKCIRPYKGVPYLDMRLESLLDNNDCRQIMENGGGKSFYCKGLGKFYYVKRIVCSTIL